jgi:exosortase
MDAAIESFNSMHSSSKSKSKHWVFALGVLASIGLFAAPLHDVLNLALGDERYSHLFVVPLVTTILIWMNRERVFVEPVPSLYGGFALVLAGVALGSFYLWTDFLSAGAALVVAVFGVLLVWTGLFLANYGIQALRTAAFPFIFLIFLVPIPDSIMDRAVLFLQKASADMSYGLFKWAGVPVFREGFRFQLPGVAIEVAEECSGIRSSMSLLLSSILAGHFVLRSRMHRISLTLLTIPVVILKNAVRIVTISMLGVYVDRGYLDGDLHHRGGVLFSAPAIAILALAVFALRKLPSSQKEEAVCPDGAGVI